MYKYKQIQNRYIVSIDNHEEIFAALQQFCTEKQIKCGVINGIGAINSLVLRFYNPKTKAYVDKEFNEQMEIANLIGNISTLDGQTYLHLHVTVAGSDYKAYAGHLLKAQLSGAGEFVVEDYGDEICRKFNEEIGLNCYDL